MDRLVRFSLNREVYLYLWMTYQSPRISELDECGLDRDRATRASGTSDAYSQISTYLLYLPTLVVPETTA